MRRARLTAFLWLLACSWAGAQEPSNLQAGDLVLTPGTCRAGFTALTGNARPGIEAPPVTEAAAPTLALSAGTAVYVPATLAGHAWCRAGEPTNLLAGDLFLSSSCRRGADTLTNPNNWPAVTGTQPLGPPLAAGATNARAFMRPPAGKVWCRATEPSNLLPGDLVSRTACRDFAPAGLSDIPFVQAVAMVTDGTSYTFTRSADVLVEISGGTWCER